jgi:hypothetical protein
LFYLLIEEIALSIVSINLTSNALKCTYSVLKAHLMKASLAYFAFDYVCVCSDLRARTYVLELQMFSDVFYLKAIKG